MIYIEYGLTALTRLEAGNKSMALYPKHLPTVYAGRDLMCEGLLSIDQAADFLSVCRATMYNLMDEGKLPFVVVKDFRGRRIPKAALRIFAEGA